MHTHAMDDNYRRELADEERIKSKDFSFGLSVSATTAVWIFHRDIWMIMRENNREKHV